MKITKPSELPDYAVLKKFAEALWRQDNAYNGAAIMVGAGFSRSAAVSKGDNRQKLPLWNDLSKALAKDLANDSGGDPLRLAEEYCAFFGKRRLYDLIEKEVNDAAWEPGELHKSLLKLPWTEVLTTNWDTLLERASDSNEVSHSYSVVLRPDHLSCTCSPRIVKLHGTIKQTENLIFTQEDYRKYPQQYAAFVNFARQVFIENELCLLGFSGDDPNFLQWAGWVRDNLASKSRRIYLVGALNLTAAKRKYLESIGIAPIDLYGLVSDYDDIDLRHSKATEIFINELRKLKPRQAWEWTPAQLHGGQISSEEFDKMYKDHRYAAKLLEQQLPQLAKDRESYPGWLVCPTEQRMSLQNQISHPYPTHKNLAEMEPGHREKLLYEIAWRCGITYQKVPTELVQELFMICNPAKPCALLKQQQLEIALLLLKNSRWFDATESNSIKQETTDILEKNSQYWPDSVNERIYHDALLARDEFDYPALENFIKKIDNYDAIWKLRKASLLAELGQFDEGEKLIRQAYHELHNQHRKDRNSIYILSRLAWAHWLLCGVEFMEKFETFPSRHYSEQKCNPFDHIEYLQREMSDIEKKQQKQAIEPLFKPGCHRESHTLTTDGRSELHFLLEGISCSAGIPLRWSIVNLLSGIAEGLAKLDTNIFCFSLAIRAASSNISSVLEKVFSRIKIARLSQKEADYLLNYCIQATNYWVSRSTSETTNPYIDYIGGRLKIFIEVLARMSVRATPEQAKEIFHLAVSLGNRIGFNLSQLFSFGAPLKDLIEFSLGSIPEPQHHELLLGSLRFPLPTEKGFSARQGNSWPNPVIELPGSRPKDSSLDQRINEIINNIEPCPHKSAPALLRLLPLIKENFLTDAEKEKIEEKIWNNSNNYQNLPITGLVNYCVLLELPSKDPSTVKNLVRRYLFENKSESLFSSLLLQNIIAAANHEVFPSAAQATDYFEKLVSWRMKKSNEDQIGDLIGCVLAISIVPKLPDEALTKANFDKLRNFYDNVEAPATVMAFPYFAANTMFVKEVENLIKKGLCGHDVNKLAYSSYALLKWKELNNCQIPDSLISRLIYMIESTRMISLSALIWTANQMYNKDYLLAEDIESLKEALPVIFDSTDYANISPSSRESVSISLVRAACVRLARDILDKDKDPEKNSKLIQILEQAKQDALPEVRFAEITKV
jgi:NAD-dependent SIR2 family protein deacetylase